jgi:hypothetical protein
MISQINYIFVISSDVIGRSFVDRKVFFSLIPNEIIAHAAVAVAAGIDVVVGGVPARVIVDRFYQTFARLVRFKGAIAEDSGVVEKELDLTAVAVLAVVMVVVADVTVGDAHL